MALLLRRGLLFKTLENMATTIGKRKPLSDQEILNSLSAQNIDGTLALQILKIRKELIDLLQLLKGL